MSLAKDNTMVSVGKVGAAVGLKGETKVRLYAEESENLYEGAVLLVDSKKYSELGGDNAVYGVDGSIELEVKSIRYQKGRPVVKFYNVADRTAAEKLAEDNRKVLIPYVDAFIKEVSLEDGTIDITLIPGLI